MRLARAVVPGFLLLLSLSAAAQLPRGRDPLSDKEIDQLRETAQEPEKRLKLMAQFAQARMETIDQMRGDTKLEADRGKRIHDLLEEFTTLMDEIDDNIDDYSERHADLRKGLKAIIESDSSFQLKLRALKDQSPPPKELSDYSFVLQNAIEAVNSNLDNARKTLDEQEVEFKETKKKK